MRNTKEELNYVRNLLNNLVANNETDLTNASIVTLSQYLDELINKYIKENASLAS